MGNNARWEAGEAPLRALAEFFLDISLRPTASAWFGLASGQVSSDPGRNFSQSSDWGPRVAPAEAGRGCGLALVCEKLQPESLETWPKAAPHHVGAVGQGVESGKNSGGQQEKLLRLGQGRPQAKTPSHGNP
jgi:hypothetical protein